MLRKSYVNKFLKDIGFYISRKICYPLVPPDVLQISVTSRCNLRCKSCSVWRQESDFNSELHLDEILNVIDECAKWGTKEAHLLGGEPLLREDWKKIASHVKKAGMSLVVCTNGTLINEDIAAELVESKVDILSVSLDGAKKETHDFLRGQKGAFEKIVNGITTLNKFDESMRPKVVLIMTVSKHNLFEMKEYVDLASLLSVRGGIYFTALVLDNVNLFSQKKTHNLWIEEKYFMNLDSYFKQVEEYSRSKEYYLGYPSFRLFARYFKGELTKRDWTCFAGLKRLVITPLGDLQICGEMVGNYRKTKSVKKAWNSYAAFKRRRFVKHCSQYCLQDCHARPESDSFLKTVKNGIKIERHNSKT